MKKALIIIGSIFVLLIITLAIAPRFINTEGMKSLVIKKIEENLQGKATIGSIQLSLLPSIKLGISDFILENKEVHKSTHQIKNPIFKANEITAGLEILPLFMGKISIKVKTEKANIDIKKLSNDKFNFELLFSETKAAEAASAGPTDSKEQLSEETSKGIDKSLSRILIKLDIKDSSLALDLRDQQINLSPIDIALNPLTLNGKSNVNVKIGIKYDKEKMHVEGPLLFLADLDMNVDKITGGKVIIDASELKSQGLPIVLGSGGKLAVTSTIQNVNLNTMDFKVNTVVDAFGFQLNAQAQSLDKKITAVGSSAEFDLASIKKFLNNDMVKNLEGKFQIQNFAYAGETYSADLNFNNVIFHLPEMPVGLNGGLTINETRLLSKELSLLINGDSVKTDARIVYNPEIDAKISMTGKRIDVSPFMKTKAKTKEEAKTEDQKTDSKETGGKSEKTLTYNPLESLGKNPKIKSSKFNFHFDLGELKLKPNYSYQNINFNFDCIGGNCKITKSQINLEPKAVLSFSSSFDLFSKTMPLNLQGNLSNVNVNHHIAAFMPEFDKKLTGTMNGVVKISGTVYPQETIHRHLNVDLDSNLKDGEAYIVDQKVILDSISKITDKIPMLKGKTFNAPEVKPEYSTMKLKFDLENGKLNLQNCSYIGKGAKPVDVETTGEIDIKELTPDQMFGYLRGKITDRANLIPLSELKNKQGHSVIPFKYDLPESKPDLAWMSKELMNQNKGQIKEKAIEKVKEKILTDENKDKAKDAAKKLLKGFGF